MAAKYSCPLLYFNEPLLLLQTKPYDYSSLTKPGATSPTAAALRPEFLTELSFHRGAVSTWLQALSSGRGGSSSSSSGGGGGGADDPPVPGAVLEGLASLAARLEGLTRAVVMSPEGLQPGPSAASAPSGAAAAAATAAAATIGWMRSEWTSALSKKPQRFLRLDCLPQELAMIYTAYAAALRHAALQRCRGGGATEEAPPDSAAAATVTGAEPADRGNGGSNGGGDGSGRPAAAAGLQAALTAAVAGLRRAAGVYGYLADELLPALSGAGAVTAGERPLELLPAAARGLQQLCLAEAQGLVAAVAEAKGMSYGTQRALHAGAASLYRAAAAAARELAAAAPAGLPPSERLAGRLLAAAEALQSARAAVRLARERQAAMELGEAEAACEEGLRLLECAARPLDRRSDPQAWLETIQAEQAECTALRAAVQRDRLAITFQPLPKQPPDALAAPAVSVAAEAFRPERVMPPAPTPEVQRQGTCAIM